jgi:hypothetical protein
MLRVLVQRILFHKEVCPFIFKPNGLGFGLLGVYAIWLLVVVLLYPLCKIV